MATRGRRAPPPNQRGSTSSIRGNQVFEVSTRSRPAAGRSPEALRQEITEESRRRSDRGLLIEGNPADRAVPSSFIVNPLFDADSVRDRNPTRTLTMSSNGNGG
jgi:hypothetical protein